MYWHILDENQFEYVSDVVPDVTMSGNRGEAAGLGGVQLNNTHLSSSPATDSSSVRFIKTSISLLFLIWASGLFYDLNFEIQDLQFKNCPCKILVPSYLSE